MPDTEVKSEVRSYLVHEIDPDETWVLVHDGQVIGKIRDQSRYEDLTNASPSFRIFLGRTSGNGRWFPLRYPTLEVAAKELAKKFEGKPR